MIKINLPLINLVILHLYRTKRTMQKTMQKYRASTFTKNRANDAKKDAIRRPRAWFPFGPNKNVFFSRSQWWASSWAQPIGSPLADRPTIQRCGAVIVIQRRGACTRPAHLVPSRRPDLRAVAWREGMIVRLTLGARFRRNPAGFRGVLSWSTGVRRL